MVSPCHRTTLHSSFLALRKQGLAIESADFDHLLKQAIPLVSFVQPSWPQSTVICLRHYVVLSRKESEIHSEKAGGLVAFRLVQAKLCCSLLDYPAQLTRWLKSLRIFIKGQAYSFLAPIESKAAQNLPTELGMICSLVRSTKAALRPKKRLSCQEAIPLLAIRLFLKLHFNRKDPLNQI